MTAASFIVPAEYYCTLELSGQRTDHASRPELNHGTIDFVVGKEYWAQPPPPRLLASTNDPSASPTKTNFLPHLQQQPPPARQPSPLLVLFSIDVSAESITAGLTQSLCSVLKQCLFAPDLEGQARHIGIIAHDAKAVYFFNLSVRTFFCWFNQTEILILVVLRGSQA